MNRFAGQLLASLGLGTAAAYGTDMLMHDPMDRLAQGARDFSAQVESAGPAVAAAYSALLTGEMSGMDRIAASMALDGQLPQAGPDGKVAADTPAGAKAIVGAMQLRQERPELAASLSRLLRSEMDLMAREQLAGQDTASVMAAVGSGAGVNPYVPAAAGIAAGGAAALVPALLARRGGGGKR